MPTVKMVTGLSYLTNSGLFRGIERFSPTLTAKIDPSMDTSRLCCFFHAKLTVKEQYQSLGYPLGKSRRGRKKWFKKIFGKFQGTYTYLGCRRLCGVYYGKRKD
jgi:hypothetical protein